MNSTKTLAAFAYTFAAVTFASQSLASNGPGALPRMPVTTPNRSLFLNGVDISSARNQDLRNVHVKITENGDIFIAAPQYQVTEEETFMPLSSYTSKSSPVEHRAPQAIKDNTSPTNVKSIDRGPSDPSRPVSQKMDTPVTPGLSQPASNAAPKTGG